MLLSAAKKGILAVSEEKRGDIRQLADDDLAAVAQDMTEGKTGVAEVILEGELYYLAFAPMRNLSWSFGALLKKSEATSSAQAIKHGLLYQMVGLRRAVESIFGQLQNFIIIVLPFLIVLMLILSRYLAGRFVAPIKKLSEGVREISGGNLGQHLNIRTGDEIEALATNFNNMTDELTDYMKRLTKATAEKERIATELGMATNIQSSMLPNVFPAFPERREFDIYATFQPAKEVGGDFYDFYLLDDNHLLVTIADVSGKGIAAALFMVIAKTVLGNLAESRQSSDNLAELVNLTNRQLCRHNEAMMFVTAFVGILELTGGRFVFVNGGHNPPLIYRARERGFAYLKPLKNCPLGVREEMVYRQEELTLEAGDLLLFYTDGITEALSESAELYGEERLLDTLQGLDPVGLSLAEILAEVKKSVGKHVGQAAQFDDMTMLALRKC